MRLLNFIAGYYVAIRHVLTTRTNSPSTRARRVAPPLLEEPTPKSNRLSFGLILTIVELAFNILALLVVIALLVAFRDYLWPW